MAPTAAMLMLGHQSRRSIISQETAAHLHPPSPPAPFSSFSKWVSSNKCIFQQQKNSVAAEVPFSTTVNNESHSSLEEKMFPEAMEICYC
ncbi:hypothetical protein A4A49_11800 [Nicotiana attenuata]|uniref:Uncharacterized protein n=1 Tax=Nicotiana attenuata TaxID=49451 RepID=A0A314L6G1_NICAT|nr:hypothetical protein A4A49_11800 [Nicotiana attenuata]